MPKMVNLASFWKTEAYAQTVSILIGQKLVENATVETCKWDIFGWFSNNMCAPFRTKKCLIYAIILK